MLGRERVGTRLARRLHLFRWGGPPCRMSRALLKWGQQEGPDTVTPKGEARAGLAGRPVCCTRDGDLRHLLHEMDDAGSRAKDLTEQILAVSRSQEQERRPMGSHTLARDLRQVLSKKLVA